MDDVTDFSMDVETRALLRLDKARARCRGHVVLLCATGIVLSLVRVTLSAATASPAGPGMALILVLCVLQLGSLARTSIVLLPNLKGAASSTDLYGEQPPLDTTAEQTEAGNQTWRQRASSMGFVGTCGNVLTLLGDLRVYAGSTCLCELLVLVLFAAGAFTGDRGADTLLDLGSSRLMSAPVSFVLSQAALCLVLVRLYTAWIAHSLHKIREDLTYVVLPESPKARDSEAKRVRLERQRLARSSMLPAWEPASPSSSLPVGTSPATPRPAWQSWLLGRSWRVVFLAVAATSLVIAAACMVLWRHQQIQARASRSTCRTAAQGLDFCVQKTYLGSFDMVSTFEQCCAACDLHPDCHAWSFQFGGKGEGGKCWQMRFDEAPCSKWPSHKDCRCSTGSDRMGGYRPHTGAVATT